MSMKKSGDQAKTDASIQESSKRGALENSQQNNVFERINDGIVVIDSQGIIQYVNQKAIDHRYEESTKNLIGKNAWQVIFKDAGRDFENACRKAIETRKPVFTDGYYQPWNRFFHSRIYPSSEGLTIYFSDVTDYKAIEDELKNNLNLIEESQEIAHLGNWYLDITSGTFRWSDEMYRIFRQGKDDFSPTIETFMQTVHADDRAALDTWFDQSLAGVKPGPLEFRIITPNGEIRWIRGDGRLIPDREGIADKMIGFALDITERRNAQEESDERQKDIEGIIKSSPIIIFILDI